MVQAELGRKEDLDAWMVLVRTVHQSFPGLETEEALAEHRQTVLRFMEQGRALCVREDHRVVGVLLFSRKHNMLCCLAVSPEHRRQGIGSVLVEAALSSLDTSRPITVSTFRKEDPKGAAPGHSTGNTVLFREGLRRNSAIPIRNLSDIPNSGEFP